MTEDDILEDDVLDEEAHLDDDTGAESGDASGDERPVGSDVPPAEGEQLPLAAAPAPESDEEPKGPPFVIEAWVLDAIEALVFSLNEPLSPARARDIIAAEMDAMEDMEGKGRPLLADMKRAFRALLDRWSQLALRDVPAPPAAPVEAAPVDAAPVEAAPVEAAPEEAPVEAAPLEAAPAEPPAFVEQAAVRGFRLVEIDGALAFRTAASQSRFIRRAQMGKPQRLSRASLETLSVIAYRQPVTKPQIEEVRGVDSSGALKALLDKKLVRVLGKAEEIGRPLLYGTTKTFLEFFEMDSLNDLPTLKELHELEHGVDPSTVDVKDDRPAVIMDLFNADQVSAVSEETERESTEAMEALEKALGEAKDVAKRASTLVFGMKVEDGDDKPAPEGAAAAVTNGGGASGPAPEGPEAPDGDAPKDEEPKA